MIEKYIKEKRRKAICRLIAAPIEVILLKHIWNYLLPYLFNLPTITYWQAFLMSILCACLFIGTNQSHLLEDINKNLEKLLIMQTLDKGEEL